MQCQRCLSDNQFPGIRFDRDGVCGECLRFDKMWGRQLRNSAVLDRTKNQLRRTLAHHKALNNQFDCVIGSCGGADSLYILYLLKCEYDLNPLVVTVNNGFLNPKAKSNLETVIQKLKLQSILIEPKFSPGHYRQFLNTAGNFCILCVYGILYYLAKTAHEHGIKLIVTGMSKRDDPFLPYGADLFNLCSIFKSCKKNGFGHKILNLKSLGLFLWRMPGIQMVHAPDYILWDQDKNRAFLEKEFSIDLSEKKYDCLMHPFANYIAKKKYGFDYRLLEYNQKIRNGKIKKSEALKKIDEAIELDQSRLKYFLDYFGLSEADVHNAIENSRVFDSRILIKFGQSLRSLYLRNKLF